ncbi:MAG: Cytochrome bd terminal oxidase subunit II, partial [uncultured Craurococcus sp.]
DPLPAARDPGTDLRGADGRLHPRLCGTGRLRPRRRAAAPGDAGGGGARPHGRLHRALLGRQRDLAGARRGAAARRLPGRAWHGVDGALHARGADALRPHPPRRRLRVPRQGGYAVGQATLGLGLRRRLGACSIDAGLDARPLRAGLRAGSGTHAVRDARRIRCRRGLCLHRCLLADLADRGRPAGAGGGLGAGRALGRRRRHRRGLCGDAARLGADLRALVRDAEPAAARSLAGRNLRPDPRTAIAAAAHAAAGRQAAARPVLGSRRPVLPVLCRADLVVLPLHRAGTADAVPGRERTGEPFHHPRGSGLRAARHPGLHRTGLVHLRGQGQGPALRL